MRFKTAVATVGIVLGVLAVAAGLGYRKYQSIRKGMAEGASRPEHAETVVFTTAEESPFQRSFTAVGTIAALRHVMLATEVAGKVIQVGFESGQPVEEGQLLVRLDSSIERAELRSAEAAAELARVTLERLEGAMANVVVKQDLDRARAELEQALARVQQLAATIDKKEIRAAFAGRVGMRDIHPGQYLSDGQSITMLQGSSDRVFVDFAVPQIQATLLRVGSLVTVSLAGREGPAEIAAINAEVDPATRNIRMRAVMPSLDGRLTPGMFVDVRVPLGEPQRVVTVPLTSVRYAPFGNHVFVITADESDASKLRARQRFVTLGGSAGGRVIVSSGIEPGERLAADGAFKLRDGALVVEGTAPPPAGGSAQATGGGGI